ncbi:gypsy retrotransposon integrase-like protein 1 isoform X2 [Latimeria chalumnae]
MLSMDSLQVAEEEVVESTSNKFEDIYKFLAEGSFPSTFCSTKRKNLKRYAQKFVLEGGCLYYVGPKKQEKREVVVDPERRRQVFLESHFTEIGHHLGQKKTVHRIQSRYYWLGIVKDVVDWIKMCEICQNAEHKKNISRKIRPVKAETPWDVLGIDLLGPFPETTRENTYILTISDYFTKWVEAIPIQKKDALSVARAISSVYYRFGAAKNIYSGQSWDFCDEVSRHLCERWNITHRVTSADYPQYTGLDDRTYELLKATIRNVVNEKQGDWDDYLDSVLFEFRTSVNSATKYTPFYLMFNREARSASEGECEIARDCKGRDTYSVKDDSIAEFTAAIQEQQNAVKEIVLANMAAAYKREKKNAKRRARSLPSLTFKVGEEVFDGGTNTPLKKQKKSHFMSFQIETVLPPGESVSGVK